MKILLTLLVGLMFAPSLSAQYAYPESMSWEEIDIAETKRMAEDQQAIMELIEAPEPSTWYDGWSYKVEITFLDGTTASCAEWACPFEGESLEDARARAHFLVDSCVRGYDQTTILSTTVIFDQLCQCWINDTAATATNGWWYQKLVYYEVPNEPFYARKVCNSFVCPQEGWTETDCRNVAVFNVNLCVSNLPGPVVVEVVTYDRAYSCPDPIE